MTSAKMEERLWNLANIITGFAIAQRLTFTVTMANNQEFYKRMSQSDSKLVTLSFIIIMCFSQWFAVHWCEKEIDRLRILVSTSAVDDTQRAALNSIYQKVPRAQKILIIFFSGIAIIALLVVRLGK